MGGSASKQEGKHRKIINSSIRSYGREVMAYGVKEAEAEAEAADWRRERKRLKKEVRRLRKKVEENEKELGKCDEEGKGWEWAVEQMSVERAMRDEAVERWKHLYLAIKTELDDLIQRTYGERLFCGTREEETEMMEELKKELKVKEGIIETLKQRIALMEREKYEKEREIDILRQSLRIIGNGGREKMKKKKKKASATASKKSPVFTKTCICSK